MKVKGIQNNFGLHRLLQYKHTHKIINNDRIQFFGWNIPFEANKQILTLSGSNYQTELQKINDCFYYWSAKQIAPPQTHAIDWANVSVVGQVGQHKQTMQCFEFDSSHFYCGNQPIHCLLIAISTFKMVF